MKKAILLVVCLFALQLQSHSQDTKITAQQWQEDLRFLQKTVHEDYPFLFKKTTKETFDAEVEMLYGQIPSMEDHEVVIGLARVVSLFKYGHTDVEFRYQQLPINLYHFNDGVFIQGVHKDYAKAIGAKVLAINNVLIEKALEDVYPSVPAENDQYFKAYGLNFLRIPEVLHAQGIIPELSDTVEFTLEKDGATFKQKFTALKDGKRVPTKYGYVFNDGNWLGSQKSGEIPHYLKHFDKIYYYEYLPEYKAVYVRHSQIQDDSTENIPTFYKRVFDFIETNDVERLVIDVRLNGGGNNYKNKAVIKGLVRSKKLQEQGSLYVITGRRTFSASQNLVNEIDNYTNAIFVGEPTAENINFYGDVNRIKLPNSQTTVALSFAWWQDKAPWEGGPWTVPHIAVDMSSKDFENGEDPVLETALTFNDTNFITDPMQHLTDLFMAGKMEQIGMDAKKMIEDPRYKFFDFEGKLSFAGHQLIGSGQYEPAMFVFQMVSQLVPNSVMAIQGMGEVYMAMGNKEKALEYFDKVISLDANGELGKKALKLKKRLTE